jgi:anti-sigma B factor antagonist
VIPYPQGISVSCTEREVVVAVTGRGTFQNSQSLRNFASEMIEGGHHDFIVDLAQCAGMDSTFLGVLAGIGLRLQHANHGGRIHIINANARNADLLQTLGLDHLFHVASGWEDITSHPPLPAEKFRQLPDSDPESLSVPLDKTRTATVMLEAHENLIQADKKNEPKFRDITRLLRQDLDRSKARNKSGT